MRLTSVKNVQLVKDDLSGMADKVPVILFGKRDESTYSLDFRQVSPLQAFSVALSAFQGHPLESV